MSEMGSVAMWAALNNRPKSKLNELCGLLGLFTFQDFTKALLLYNMFAF